MRSKINLFFTACLIILIEFGGCNQLPPPFHKDGPANPDSATFSFYYFLVIYPQQQRQISCSQPNAIFTTFGGSLVGCISGKVTQGLIYDASTNQAITVDTISPSQSFLCKCNAATSSHFSWERGAIQDNPPSGITTSKIFNSYDSGHTINDALVYKTHYNQPDNLYCIPGNCGFSEYKYQFLKIR